MGNYFIKQHPNSECLLIAFPLNREMQLIDHINEFGMDVIFVSKQEQGYSNGISGMGNSFEEALDFIRNYIVENAISRVSVIGDGAYLLPAIQYGIALDTQVLGFDAKALLKKEEGEKGLVSEVHEVIRDSECMLTTLSSENDSENLYASIELTELMKVKRIAFRRMGLNVITSLYKSKRLFPLINEFGLGKTLSGLIDVGKSNTKPKFLTTYNRAEKSYKNEKYAEAIELGIVAAENYYASDSIHLLLANSYCTLNQIDKAAAQYAQAVALSPASVYPAFMHANMMKRKGDVNLAIYLHKRNRKSWPKHSQTLYDLGLCYVMKNDSVAAANYIKLACELNPSNETYRKRLDPLQSASQ